MKPDQQAIKIFAAGALTVAIICGLQAYTDLVHGTVYVLITGFYMLWLLRSYRIFSWIGILVTAGIVIGYIFGHEHGPGPLVNRIFSVFIFWLAVRFTERFRALSAEEKKNRSQLNALFQNVGEAILLIDQNGKIVMGNPRAIRIFGYEKAELEKLVVEDLVPERFRGKHDDLRRQFVLSYSYRQIGSGKNIFGLAKNGREFPIELGLSTYYENDQLFVIAFVTDITRRKQQEERIVLQNQELQRCNIRLEEQVRLRTSELTNALDSVRKINENLVREIGERKIIEEQLSKSQNLYRAMAKNFPDGIIGILNRDWKYVFLEGRELSGFPIKLGTNEKRILDGLHKVVLDHYGREIRKAFEGEKNTFEIQAEGYYYDVIVTPFTETDQPVTEVLIVIRNITRYKKYEEGLKLALEKEKQLNVLKSRFVSNVSHEFRTPLSTIMSSVFLLENDDRPNAAEQKRNHFTRIRRAVTNLTELLEDFLSLEKLAEGKVSLNYSGFHISSFLQELIAELDPIKKAGQKIEFSFYDGDDWIVTDRSILSNIINNLVSNAIKYSRVDGVISVQGGLEGDHFRLSISDNGMGIPENEQPHIFERFYRAHNAANIQGTGLGLNLVKKYLSLLNGTVSFESVLNEGSTFRISIPANRDITESHDTESNQLLEMG